MKDQALEVLSEDALVEQFRQHALHTSEVLLDSNVREANSLFDKMEAIDTELRRRGPAARKALLNLLNDDDLRVRFEAAVRSLAVDPQAAMATLKRVQASHYMPVAAEAGLTMRHIEEGIFKPT